MKLVLDWDGTVTEVDSLKMVIVEFGDADVFARTERLEGELSLREIMKIEFDTVRAELGEVIDWVVEHVRVRPGFRELVEAHDPLVVSSGFHEVIEPILEREGIEVELLANRVDARPDGWRVLWREEQSCRTCGEPCKRGSLPDGANVYVGDGYSDHCAALAADRVFARDGLARYLEREGVPYEPFDDLFTVARALDGAGGLEHSKSKSGRSAAGSPDSD